MEAMQLVLHDGRIFAAEQALPHLFLMLRRWQWMARIFRLPVVALLAPLAYRFVARNRYIISVLVAKKEGASDPRCSVDGTCE